MFRLVAAAIAVLPLTVLAWAGGGEDAQTVPLKSFKFEVKEDLAALFGLNEEEGKLFFYTNGPAVAVVKIAKDGEYDIAVKASGDTAKDVRAKFKLMIDGMEVGKETLLTADDARDYKFSTKLKAGERKLSIAFTNDEYKENEYDRNLYVHGVTLKRAK